MKKYKDIISGSFLLVTSIIYIIVGLPIKKTYIDPIVGSRFFPLVCGIVIATLSIMLIFEGIRNLKNYKEEIVEEKSVEENAGKLSPNMKTILVLVCFAAFVWLLDKIGFTLSTMLYLYSQMILMAGKKISKKDYVLYFVGAVVLSVGIYYLFNNAFSLIMPKATWF